MNSAMSQRIVRRTSNLGSNLSLITANQYFKIGAPELVSDTLLHYDLLIGNDVLRKVNVVIDAVKVFICDTKESPGTNSGVHEIFKMDVINERNEIDLPHIANARHRGKIKTLIANYRPVKVRETDLEMNIILKDEETVYARSRRLSPKEKDELDAEINKWLADGIMQPSFSDYASPVVLVRKKDGLGRLCIDY
ncbi:uncharacterized protein LOC122521618 [Polistes fuscatus]|uniref:uncharacterized protein LOC122521618 n=1 Tax=Polistes fuscatus TaxID=30207 RepID=UPI001CA8327F|nr:uncharacterized protein LOC122521618 [Polistes fuscatus]